jgi:phosphonate transport system ATP-binding protein
MTVADPSPGGFTFDQVSVALGGRNVLDRVDLHVEPGEAVAVVGPSGAGKTTLLRLLTGAVRPAAGTVTVAGYSLQEIDGSDLRRLRSRIGFIHQDLRLVPNLRVSQNVLSGRLGRTSFCGSLRMFFRPGRADLEEVHRLLDRVGISEKMFERVDRLSGGQAQRVAVARALFQHPCVMLADEPVASVDPVRGRALIALLREICREAGLTLCVSLHNPDLVREFFPRAVGLRAGRVVFDRATADIGGDEFAGLYRLEAAGES